MELIVSVILLFLLVFFLTANYQTLSKAATQAKKYEALESVDYAFNDLLVKDILQANRVAITRGRDYDILYLYETRNSLHSRGVASVAYCVLKENKSLLRVEGRLPFRLPIVGSIVYRYNFLPFEGEVKSFKAYKSRKFETDSDSAAKNCALLLYLDSENTAEPKLLEFGLLNTTACE
ncbi:MAG: hypothetical protein LBU73_01145 [Helicobacteraceae bacterium]|nr:hypothetical protein [Helicobacteraceae bacterium]